MLEKNLLEVITTEMDPQLSESLAVFEAKFLREFKIQYGQCTMSSVGGISVCEAFWLYFLVKAIKPRQIIESGTLFGYSLYFIQAAVDWPCRILSFDVDQSKSWRFPKVEYHECDWTAHPEDKLSRGEGTLVFFDDHVDHDDRLEEAFGRNQHHLVFHDNYLTKKHSHYPIRFCDLMDTAFCYTFPRLCTDPIFLDQKKNAQTYRWLTYLQRGGE